MNLILGLFVMTVTVNTFFARAATGYAIVKEEGYTESKVCATCHTDIHKQWANSLHASSFSDPVFLGVYNELEEGEDRKYCLKCHAPLVRVSRDYDFSQTVTKEGVSCDFCHTIRNVDLSKEEPFEFALGAVKGGPFESEVEIGHRNIYSEIYLKSEFCAGCHEVVNENGFHVISTYTEWKNGPYAAMGVQCQNCHMPEVLGVSVVNPEIAETTRIANAHKFVGGHSEINISRAATLNQVIHKVNDRVSVVVYVTNSEAGHYLPTGIPSRKVILTVKLLGSDRKVLEERNVVFTRVLLDAEGAEILEANIKDMFLKAASVKSDNRLKPKETRREEFGFSIPKVVSKTLLVESALDYEFGVPYLAGNVMKLRMIRDEQLIEIDEPTIGMWGWFALVIAVLVVLFLLQITYQKLRR